MNNTKKRYIKMCNEFTKILHFISMDTNCIKCALNGCSCCLGVNDEFPVCKYLGENGCTTLSISCKVYICDDYRKLLTESKYYNKWKKLEAEALSYNWIYCTIEELELSLIDPFFRLPQDRDVNFRRSIEDYSFKKEK